MECASSSDPERGESSSVTFELLEDRLKSFAVVSPAALLSSVANFGIAFTPFDAFERTFFEIFVIDICLSSIAASSRAMRLSAEPTDRIILAEEGCFNRTDDDEDEDEGFEDEDSASKGKTSGGEGLMKPSEKRSIPLPPSDSEELRYAEDRFMREGLNATEDKEFVSSPSECS